MNTPSAAQFRLDHARSLLLGPNGLDETILAATLSQLHGGGTEFADLFFERTARESWRLEDQTVTSGQYSVSQGVGIRTVAGDQSALAYSSDLTPRSLAATARSARDMQRRGLDAARVGGAPVFRPDTRAHNLFSSAAVIEPHRAEQKVALLRDIDRKARAVDPRIKRVSAQLRVIDSTILLATSDGRLAADVRPLVQIHLSVVAEQNGKLARGAAGVGGRYTLDDLDDAKIANVIRRAASQALVNLDARPAPAGVMPVVLGPGFPGVLLHEAVGHGLEGDAHRTRSSVFTDCLGATIAAPGVTVVDDGTLARKAGSLNVDDEGKATERTVLIEDGRLAGLMQDNVTARLMKMASTGNSRRESYAHLPMVRMTNTFMVAGTYDPEEIIASVKNGIYAAEFGGGSVDITSGRFNFSTKQAFLIEGGKITAPISGATLIGVGHEALKHISMIGDNLALDEGEAVCTKQGQSVVVGVGQPSVLIDQMVVGGSA